MSELNKIFIQNLVASYFKEDDFHSNFSYIRKLPTDTVSCRLKFKQDMLVAGLPFFMETFNYLLSSPMEIDGDGKLLDREGSFVKKGEEARFELPFSVALTGERIALNLLQRASSIATFTRSFVVEADKRNIKILDTRKTTPGHRALEKYAVNTGGGHNHRFGQADCWMIKDNHKSFFGGLENAINFFKDLKTFYQPLIVEIHDLEELAKAIDLDARHLMLDNFIPAQIQEAIKLKTERQTYEVSGGVRLANLNDYLIDGVDAISVGALTYDAPHVDISLKYEKI
ncbi:MAG: carboxylating nicotinate-nucleotide diphosphorylase [Bacteriovoracaceae bacterium]